ncbi:hypothetical protein SprV_0100263600 [Sparganum proliferum]
MPLSTTKKLLRMLRPYHPEVPKYPRTLLQTPRTCISKPLNKGNYVHLGLERGLQDQLHSLPETTVPEMHIQLQIDGMKIFKGSSQGLWPILARVRHPVVGQPFIVGVFSGPGKPDPLDDFLGDCVGELKDLLASGLRIPHTQNSVKVVLDNVICDTPADVLCGKLKLTMAITGATGETVKTGAAYFEANRITAVKAICETRKSQLPLPPPHNPIAQPPSTCSRCQRTFLATIGLVIHLRTNFSTRTAPTVVSPSTSPSSPMPSDNVDRPPQPPLPSSSSTVSTPAAVASAMPINTTHNPVTSINVNTTAVNTGDEDPVYTCPHWDRTFTSRIGPIGHLRIRGTGIDRSSDIPSTSSSPITTISITEADTDIADFSCPHCPRTFTSRVGLVAPTPPRSQTDPTQMQLPQNSVDSDDSRPFQYISVWDLVLPPQLQYSTKTTEVEVVESACLLRLHRPGISPIQQRR